MHLKTLGWSQTDDTTRAAFEGVKQQLLDAGVAIVDASTNHALAELERMLLPCDDIATAICMYELRWPVAAYAQARGAGMLGDAVRARLEIGLRMTPDDYRKALQQRDAIRRQVLEAAGDADGFITLASSGPAPLLESGNAAAPAHGEDSSDGGQEPPGGGGAAHLATGSRSFLSPWSMVGGPSLSLPWMAVDGLPLGLQLMGKTDSDFDLVGIARWADGT